MLRFTLLVTITLTLCLGCGDSNVTSEGSRLHSTSSQSLVVGQSLEFYFTNTEFDRDGRYRLFFEGSYRTDDGAIEPVQITQSVIEDGFYENEDGDLSALRLNRFGPFLNPFSERGRPGRFEGTVSVVQVSDDDQNSTIVSSQSLALGVEPSILIEKFQPIDANCSSPALRALPGLAYELTVSARGIAPTKFTYEIGRANDVPIKVIEHTYDAPVATDTIGEIESLIFNAIDQEEQFYVTTIRVVAEDGDGNSVESALPISVHRPIEVVHSGKKVMAERYEPVPVSGCKPGTLGGRVEYSESKVEYRQSSVSLTVARSWTNSQGIGTSESWREGVNEGERMSRSQGGSTDEGQKMSEDFGVSYSSAEENRVSVSTRDGVNYGWSRREGESDTDYEDRLNRIYGATSIEGTVSATAEGSVPGFAKASGTVSTTAGAEIGGATGRGMGSSRTRTSDRGFSTDDREDRGRRFGSTTSERRSESMNGSFALSNNSSNSFQDDQSRERSQTWDFAGSIAEQTVVSEGLSESEEQTWSNSSQTETTRSYSAELPLSKYGQFFRQTTRWVQVSELRSFDQCGVATRIGELQFNTYTWAPDFAMANSCEEIRTNLSSATCIVSPCN